MGPGVPYVASVRDHRTTGTVLRLVCQHCGEDHEVVIEPVAIVRNEGSGDVARLALAAVWLATHTGRHRELLKEATS